jgi:hypothetical protein
MKRTEAWKQHHAAQRALTKILKMAEDFNLQHHGTGKWYLRWPNTDAGQAARRQFITLVVNARNAEDLEYNQALHRGAITEWDGERPRKNPAPPPHRFVEQRIGG